ncbi:MAG: hydantoinase B/oxoprolinase family protein [Dehalococcoidia bacterium]
MVQGGGIAVHVSALSLAGAAVRDYFGEEIDVGDLYALNDPYFGGSHIPDITVTCPIFYQGRLIFCSANRAHHTDVGGPTHGATTPPLASYTRRACASHP